MLAKFCLCALVYLGHDRSRPVTGKVIVTCQLITASGHGVTSVFHRQRVCCRLVLSIIPNSQNRRYKGKGKDPTRSKGTRLGHVRIFHAGNEKRLRANHHSDPELWCDENQTTSVRRRNSKYGDDWDEKECVISIHREPLAQLPKVAQEERHIFGEETW